METRITDSLKALMMRQDMRSQAAGTARAAERDAGRSPAKDALPPIGLMQGGQHQPIRIAWNNPSMVKTVKRGDYPTALTMIVCRP